MQVEMSKDQSTLMDLTGLISELDVLVGRAWNRAVVLNQQEAQASIG